jgi:phage terminase Nu1 subunit (DNA packaging protein)
MADQETGATIISGAIVCQLLMLSRQRIDQLVRSGHIKRLARGQYSLVEAVQGYIRFLRDEAHQHTASAADSRVRDARAREIETRTAQRLGRLVPLEVYEETIDTLCGMVRSEFAGLPAAVTRELPMRRIIERDVNARLRRIAEAALAAAARLETDRSPADAVRDHGAGRMGGGESDVPVNGGGSGAA